MSIQSVDSQEPVRIGPILLRASKANARNSTMSLPMMIGTIVDSRQVLTMNNTVVDPEASRRGGIIHLPIEVPMWHGNGKTSSLWVPRFWHTYQGPKIQLHPIAGIANSVARACEEFKQSKRTEVSLRRLVNAYWTTLMQFACGKQGLLSTSVLGCRVMDSGRAVLIPNGFQDPFSVGLPQEMMSRIRVEEGDVVIVGRDPTIWHGSIEILRAFAVTTDCIELHPLVFKQFNADSDGDEVYVMRIPTTPGAREAAIDRIGTFTKEHAVWPPYLREGGQGKEVNWATVEEESLVRCRMTGFSISPKDVLDESEHIRSLCARTGKDVSAECKKIANGISPEEVERYIQDQNDANLKMKLGLGPVGQLCTRIVAICGMNENLIGSASYISEHLSQEVLDQKHTVTTNRVVYDAQQIIDLFHRRGIFVSATLEEAIEVLESIGLKKKRCVPFMAYLWYGYPTMCAMFDLCKDPKQYEASMKIIQMIFSSSSFARIAARLVKMWNTTEETFKASVQSYSFPIDKIFIAHYPAAGATEAAAETRTKVRKHLCKRIFVEGHEDSRGPSRIAMRTSLRRRDPTLRTNNEVQSV